MRKLAIVLTPLLILALMVGVAGCGGDDETTPTPNEIITFPDPKLEAVIRKEIQKLTGDIYQSDVAGIKELEARQEGITNLSGLENCTALTYLALDENQISDISPLSGLTGLTELRLPKNQLSDISPLSNLTSLTDLQLGENHISDISPLSNLTKLVSLYLYGNRISDISPLSSLTKLWRLSIDGNQISDVSPLSNLTDLSGLGLRSNRIGDVSPLVKNRGLGKGDEIILSNNPLDTASVNEYIPQLEQRGAEVEW